MTWEAMASAKNGMDSFCIPDAHVYRSQVSAIKTAPWLKQIFIQDKINGKNFHKRKYQSGTIAHVIWLPLQRMLSWYTVMHSSLSDSFEDWTPVDFIYICQIFKWESCNDLIGHQVGSPEKTTRVTCTIVMLAFIILQTFRPQLTRSSTLARA